jgi:hypothetical protein
MPASVEDRMARLGFPVPKRPKAKAKTKAKQHVLEDVPSRTSGAKSKKRSSKKGG